MKKKTFKNSDQYHRFLDAQNVAIDNMVHGSGGAEIIESESMNEFINQGMRTTSSVAAEGGNESTEQTLAEGRQVAQRSVRNGNVKKMLTNQNSFDDHTALANIVTQE